MAEVVQVGPVSAGPGEKTYGRMTVLERPASDVFMPVETTAVFEKQPPTPSGSTL